MRRHALVNNNIVTEIIQIDLDTDEYIEYSRKNHLIIDVEDDPMVNVGFILQGNKLVPANTLPQVEVTDLYQQTAQRLFGQKILPDLIDQVGARNLKLTREQAVVDVAALGLQMNMVQILLNGGALKTARGLCAALKPMFPHHSDILDLAINKITEFLIQNKWN